MAWAAAHFIFACITAVWIVGVQWTEFLHQRDNYGERHARFVAAVIVTSAFWELVAIYWVARGVSWALEGVGMAASWCLTKAFPSKDGRW